MGLVDRGSEWHHEAPRRILRYDWVSSFKLKKKKKKTKPKRILRMNGCQSVFVCSGLGGAPGPGLDARAPGPGCLRGCPTEVASHLDVPRSLIRHQRRGNADGGHPPTDGFGYLFLFEAGPGYGSTSTTAEPLLHPATGRCGEPGMVSGRSSGRATSTLTASRRGRSGPGRTGRGTPRGRRRRAGSRRRRVGRRPRPGRAGRRRPTPSP